MSNLKVTIQGMGKFPNSFVCKTEDGRTTYLSGGKFLKTPITIGATYEIETYQAEGKKTVYINKAKLVSGGSNAPRQNNTPIQVGTSSTSNRGREVESEQKYKKAVVPNTSKTDPDRMSKADWEKKDKGIKWISCLKSSAEFHARRCESDIKLVIDDAIRLYYAEPGTHETIITSEDDITTEPETVSKEASDLFEENGI